jgi:alcohol dehydrogenase
MTFIARTRVAINRLALPLINFPKPFSFVGPDTALSLCRAIVRSGAKRVLIVTDGPLQKLGIVDPICAALREGGVTVDVFSDVEPDPSEELIAKGIAHLQKFGADAVLAVGGGSPIDCAKTLLLCHANNAHPKKLAGLWMHALPRKRGLPFYAMPTTAGTGSEVTIAAVVSDKTAQVKYAIIDPKTCPDMVALDPKLTLGLPPHITAPTGMDALTHAVESYLSTMALPETDQLARTATAMIVRSLPTAYRDGSNLIAREDMLVASSMAGLAFTRAGVGYIHAIAHQLGALYHVPHGLANAIVMPHVLDYSKSHCAQRLADLAQVAGIHCDSHDPLARANAFIAHIRQMNADMGIPTTVKELRREDIALIASRALQEAHGTYAVPRYMDMTQAQALISALLSQ